MAKEMKGMRRHITLFAASVVFLALAAQCFAIESSIEKIDSKGESRINWTAQMYLVKGYGAVNKTEPNRARAYLRAKDYAKMEAIAHLRMAIDGTTINYESTGKDYEAETTIKMKIEGFVKNVTIERDWVDTFEGDKMVGVEAKAPMFGQGNAPGAVFLGADIEKQKEAEESGSTQVDVDVKVKVVTKPDNAGVIKPAPPPVEAKSIDPEAPDVTAVAKPSQAGKPYTGVVIDCTGYNIQRAMSPKIRKADGSEVWGTVKMNYDEVLERGIVGYATSLEDGKKLARAGSNPMVVRAKGRSGGRFYCDPVISDGDAEVMLYENSKSQFLDKYNVVFVKDKLTR
jgi:hypothetical protein